MKLRKVFSQFIKCMSGVNNHRSWYFEVWQV